MKKLFALVLFIGLSANVMLAQDAALNATLQYMQTNLDKLDLTAIDIQDYVVTDQYTSKHNNATHIYLRQRYQGIEIYNAIFNATLNSNNTVVHTGNRYIKDIALKINGTSPSLTPVQAVEKAAKALDITVEQSLQLLQTIDNRNYTVAKSGISLEVIPVKLMYQPMKDGSLRLAWDLSIYTIDANNWWSVRIDALSGDLLNKYNWVIHCKAHNLNYTNHTRQNRIAQENCTDHTHALPKTNMVGAYNVFAMPLESPIHGNRTLTQNPDNAIASPFGWHDTDGVTGPEFTITRGNNVHAYADTAGLNQSIGNEPDGGAGLVFDFPLNLTLEPNTYQDAAVTNLFYWNNVVHDVWYQYGFNEQSGNFQSNNYGNGGVSGDAVQAEAQDGSGINNANFTTPPDGSSGRMQMFRWDNNSGDILNLNDGAAQGGYEVIEGNFGPGLTTTGVSGTLVLSDDGTLNSTEGCNPLVNGAQISGNIAIIDRGSCQFTDKVLNAQNAGAIAAIVCNNQPGLITMAPGVVANQITIPSVFLGQVDCNAIKVSMQSTNVQATLALPLQNGPNFLDADLDNSVITHEYGHGISIRLTGGPSNANCLGNEEQQGEGWSDWFAMVITVEPGDMGTDSRGMGVYSAGQPVTGRGIRSTAYSTDMSINDKTMSSVVLFGPDNNGNFGVHGIGSVWASMIWDLYWDLVSVHGYDNDIYNGTGGNNIAMQLVIDGLKMQPCNPSFTDARDAILSADMLTYNGANQCVIWKTFARRGLGVNADSGDPNNRLDFVEDYNTPLSCVNNIFVTKTAVREAEADTDITYTIEVTNLTSDTLTNVILTDTLASNLTYVSGSASCTVVSSSNGVVELNIGNMLPNDVLSCTFDATVAVAPFTSITFLDSVEDATVASSNWISIADQGTSAWVRDQLNPRSGSWAWYAPTPSPQSDFSLTTANTYTISGAKPALRFFHSYDITPGIEAGVVEVSTDFTTWADVGRYAISGAYNGPILTTDLTLAPGRSGFYGNSNGYIETLIDLTPFLGQTLYFRFRVASDDTPTSNTGWFIDDISLVDLMITPNTAKATSGTWEAYGSVEEGGTIIWESSTTSTKNALPAIKAAVYPNPTNKEFMVQMAENHVGEVHLALFSVDGRRLLSRSINNVNGTTPIRVDVEHFAEGVYFVELITKQGSVTKKLVIQK